MCVYCQKIYKLMPTSSCWYCCSFIHFFLSALFSITPPYFSTALQMLPLLIRSGRSKASSRSVCLRWFFRSIDCPMLSILRSNWHVHLPCLRSPLSLQLQKFSIRAADGLAAWRLLRCSNEAAERSNEVTRGDTP